MTADLAIEVDALTKIYGSTPALINASLKVVRGEIHGLLGENGAGKSTLVRILAGVEEADAGKVRILGHDAVGGVAERTKQGAAFIHQDLAVFNDMSVADTIALVGGFRRRMGVIDTKGTIADAEALIERLGMDLNPRAQVGELTLADQTAVAVARALSAGAQVVVLDEPTAYLEAREARRLFQLLGRLRDAGVACLIITHRLADVLTSCDAVTVLRDGKTVGTEPATEITERQLIRLITGHDAAENHHRADVYDEQPIAFESHGLSGAGFYDVSFTVRAGEAVSLCGLADAGHFSVGEAIFGVTASDGEVVLSGQALSRCSVTDAIGAGVAFVPRDRRALGLALDLTARENIFMRPDQRWFKMLSSERERSAARTFMERLVVRPPDPERVVATLSGGNQQKVLLAKWIRRDPRLIILNEPTAGVDVGAKAEIAARLRQLRTETGLAVIVITSDFAEVADLSDRAVVMRHGRVVGHASGAQLAGAALTELAYGGVL